MTFWDDIALTAGGAVLLGILRAVFIEPHRETQAQLTRLERSVDRLLQHAGLETDTERLPARVVDLLMQGRRIEAIKVYREESGVGLKEAKDAVERAQRSLL